MAKNCTVYANPVVTLSTGVMEVMVMSLAVTDGDKASRMICIIACNAVVNVTVGVAVVLKACLREGKWLGASLRAGGGSRAEEGRLDNTWYTSNETLVSAIVGDAVGVLVGVDVGAIVEEIGAGVGVEVGVAVGVALGLAVGDAVGDTDGAAVGT